MKTDHYKMSAGKGAILEEKGNTCTNQWENDNLRNDNDPLINELLDTMKVEIGK